MSAATDTKKEDQSAQKKADGEKKYTAKYFTEQMTVAKKPARLPLSKWTTSYEP